MATWPCCMASPAMCGDADEAVSDAGGAEGRSGGCGSSSWICLPRVWGRLHLHGRRAPRGSLWRFCVRGMRVLPLTRWAAVSLAGICPRIRQNANVRPSGNSPRVDSGSQLLDPLWSKMGAFHPSVACGGCRARCLQFLRSLALSHALTASGIVLISLVCLNRLSAVA